MARLRSEAGFTLTELLIVTAIVGFTMAAVLGIYQVTQRSTLFASAGEDAQVTARAVLNRLAADFQLLSAGLTTTTGAISTATASSITFLGDVDNTLDSGGSLLTLSAQFNAGDTSVTLTAPPAGTSVTNLFPCGSLVTLSDGPIVETHPLVSPGCVAGNTLTLASALFTYYPAGSLVRSVETVSYAWDLATQTLCRSAGTACPAAPYTDDQTIATGVANFQLTYLGSAGPIPDTSTQAGRDSIKAIQLQISISSKSGDQTVTRLMSVSVRPRNL